MQASAPPPAYSPYPAGQQQYPPEQQYKTGGPPPEVQQGGYPPAYNQQQPPPAGFAPGQPGGYPPQQHGAYPPQQQGYYPPQQGGYPPPQQQGGYAAPPSTFVVTQQPNVVVIQNTGNCPSCHAGNLSSGIPCWAIAMIILMILLFWPLAFVFCCIQERRCPRCGYTQTDCC